MIIIYSRKTCAPCHQLKRFLTLKSAPFQEIDIDEDPEAAKTAYELAGAIVPVTVIGDQVIRGLDLRTLSSLL